MAHRVAPQAEAELDNIWLLTFSDWIQPGPARAASLHRVGALILIQENPATIFSIANTRAMLSVGQKCSKEIAALAAEQAALRF